MVSWAKWDIKRNTCTNSKETEKKTTTTKTHTHQSLLYIMYVMQLTKNNSSHMFIISFLCSSFKNPSLQLTIFSSTYRPLDEIGISDYPFSTYWAMFLVVIHHGYNCHSIHHSMAYWL